MAVLERVSALQWTIFLDLSPSRIAEGRQISKMLWRKVYPSVTKLGITQSVYFAGLS